MECGEVKVLINYSESSETIAMYNENSKVSSTEETDTSGGIRTIQENDIQKEIIYQETEDGSKIPITQKVIEPKIEGAIITAKGADSATVKANIVQAVEAVTGLATHKIQVFKMN
jgi:stage III sporulation protein AG